LHNLHSFSDMYMHIYKNMCFKCYHSMTAIVQRRLTLALNMKDKVKPVQLGQVQVILGQVQHQFTI